MPNEPARRAVVPTRRGALLWAFAGPALFLGAGVAAPSGRRVCSSPTMWSSC
jgi:hypothetical protein